MAKDKEFYVRDLTIDDEYDTISANDSVKDAALKMKELGIPDLVVINEEDNKKVLGVIADFDIVTGIVAEGLSAETSKVTEVMYTIEPVSKDTPVSTAFTRMRDLDVSIIPVLEKDELIGVATITDCWGYLPEKYEDQRGWIAVNNPRFANYGFTILMTLLYFCFGILAPFAGFTGFIKAPVAGSAIVSQLTTYGLFDARGGGFYISYFEFQGTYSLIWLGMFLYGIIFLILGIFSTWCILHWSNADYHLVQIDRNWQAIGLIIGIINLLIEWGLFLLVVTLGAFRVPNSEISIDFFGLVFTGLAIIFLIAAVTRDILFRESTPTIAKEE